MSQTFTDELRNQYDAASKANKGQTGIYHCATPKGLTPRNLDLSSEYVFCDIRHKDNPPKKNKIFESRLAAFLITKALENKNLLLPIKGKEWKLLDAERNFASADLSEEGKGKRLDILAYEAKTNSYIVIELKVGRRFTEAKNELERYTDTIKNHIGAANSVYSVEASNVKGYIVWKSTPGKPREIDNQWGLIEYDEVVLKEDVDKLDFSIITEPVG